MTPDINEYKAILIQRFKNEYKRDPLIILSNETRFVEAEFLSFLTKKLFTVEFNITRLAADFDWETVTDKINSIDIKEE